MSVLLIILLIFVGYMVVAGMLHNWYHRVQAGKCHNCASGKPYTIDYRNVEPGYGHSEATPMALAWPFTLPFVFAASHQPQVKRGMTNVANYWKVREAEDHARHIAEMERITGIGQH